GCLERHTNVYRPQPERRLAPIPVPQAPWHEVVFVAELEISRSRRITVAHTGCACHPRSPRISAGRAQGLHPSSCPLRRDRAAGCQPWDAAREPRQQTLKRDRSVTVVRVTRRRPRTLRVRASTTRTFTAWEPDRSLLTSMLAANGALRSIARSLPST